MESNVSTGKGLGTGRIRVSSSEDKETTLVTGHPSFLGNEQHRRELQRQPGSNAALNNDA